MGDDLEIEVVSIERIDDMLDGFAWAQVSLGLGDPARGPCPEVVMRVPIRYEAGDTIDAVRARIWREGVRVVHAVAKLLDADMPPPVQPA
jgi:hypothetical protein